MNWKKNSALLLIAVMIMAIVGCGQAKQETAAPKGKKTKIVFWYSLGGKISATTKQMIEEFNQTHPDIEVEGIYQGSYDDAINKLKRAIQSKDTPNIIQVYDIGTRFMIDSKAVVPVQKWVDSDKYDLSAFEPNILAYYTVDKQLYSMPFNTSTPILYYNKDMFKAAGLDPAKPPQTFAEVAEAANKLTVKDGSGKVTRSGISLAIYGWFFEQFLAVQNSLYADNGNGRNSLATKVVFNSPEGQLVINWWNKMVQDGAALNLGRGTANTQKAFASGQVAMTVDSTAVLADIMNGVGGKFQVGTAFLPRPQGASGGVAIGGGSLWMLGGHTPEEEKASWELIKFLSSPKQQAKWHISTGYFPTTKKAYDEPEVKKHHEQYPQFKVAIDQLHSTPISPATQGALLGVFTQSRQEIENAIEQVISGQAKTDEALNKAAETVNAAIERFNKTR